MSTDTPINLGRASSDTEFAEHPEQLRVGFVGLGMMGAPMVRSLAANGWPVTVFDMDRSRAQAVAAGSASDVGRCRAANSLSDLADCNLVITMLPTSDSVESVLIGGSLASSLAPGSLLVDMSSSVPDRTVRLGVALANLGLALIDAPVSGGVARARNGELTVMVGGGEGDVQRALPVLRAMASKVLHVGPLGSGHAVKALNNVLSACGLLIAVEATEVARRFGIDPDVFLETVNQSTGRNHATETKIARYVLSEAYDSGFSAKLMLKDLHIAQDLALSTGAPTQLVRALVDAWETSTEDLSATADQTEVARYLAHGR